MTLGKSIELTVDQIFGYATNHSWRNSLLATSDERDSQNYIVRDVDSDFSDYTDNSAHNAEDHAEIDIDGDQTDDVVALNKSASEKSYLSSLEPTPEPLNSMSMHPAAPVACMVPKKPPMGNTQAKLAAFRNDDNTALGSHIITGQFQTQYATSSKGQGEWHNSTPAEFAMQEIDDTLSSSAQGYLDPSPQPRPKIRRLKLHSGKRAADDDNHVTSKRRKQMQTQMVRYCFVGLIHVPTLTTVQRMYKVSPQLPACKALDSSSAPKVDRPLCCLYLRISWRSLAPPPTMSWTRTAILCLVATSLPEVHPQTRFEPISTKVMVRHMVKASMFIVLRWPQAL